MKVEYDATMTTLKASSRVVRWAFLLERAPSTCTVCELFWRSVLASPFKCVILAIVSPFLLCFWLALDVCAIDNKAPALISRVRRSLVAQLLWGWKQRMCPIVHIEREDVEVR